MFGCICPNNHMKRRCDRIFSLVNHNPCVGKCLPPTDIYRYNDTVNTKLKFSSCILLGASRARAWGVVRGWLCYLARAYMCDWVNSEILMWRERSLMYEDVWSMILLWSLLYWSCMTWPARRRPIKCLLINIQFTIISEIVSHLPEDLQLKPTTSLNFSNYEFLFKSIVDYDTLSTISLQQ